MQPGIDWRGIQTVLSCNDMCAAKPQRRVRKVSGEPVNKLSIPSAVMFVIALQVAGCADAGAGRDIADPGDVFARDVFSNDFLIDSAIRCDAFNDAAICDVTEQPKDVGPTDVQDVVDFQPCDSDADICGLNQTCLVGKDLQPFCECLPPFVWWDNIVLPDEPVELDYYRLIQDAICLQQMPDEYFYDLPGTWWDEDSILYGFPDGEDVIIEPVFMWYDDSARVLHFGVGETEFTVREDGIAINLSIRDDGRTGWAYLLKLTTTRAVMNTFDWPSGKLTNSWALLPN